MWRTCGQTAGYSEYILVPRLEGAGGRVRRDRQVVIFPSQAASQPVGALSDYQFDPRVSP